MLFPIATANTTLLTPLPTFSKLNAVTNKLSVTVTPNLPVKNKLTASPSPSSSPYTVTVTDKLTTLASEFNSLTEPIDRVKKLLHYASLLPPLENSHKVPENRVAGCTTEVWVVAEMDSGRRMRFRADSDSEISKGFCWCLIWMLDGAEAEEVLMVEKEELVGMNVGLNNVRERSRVNTWQNVFFAMQKATVDLVEKMDGM